MWGEAMDELPHRNAPTCMYMLEKPNEGRGAVGGLGEVGVDIIALQKNTATVGALKLNMRFSFKYKDAVQRHMRFI